MSCLKRYNPPSVIAGGVNKQAGVVLFIALIMLVAMTMAGLALMRGIGSGLGIASNLAFKQIATSQTDFGVESARNWLVAQTTSDALNSSITASGYFSSWDPSFSPATYDWEGNSRLISTVDCAGNTSTTDCNGNEVRIVIHRLCEQPDLAVTASTQKCVTVKISSGGSQSIGSVYNNPKLSEQLQAYYRVTARVRGPRNTISYSQVIMY